MPDRWDRVRLGRTAAASLLLAATGVGVGCHDEAPQPAAAPANLDDPSSAPNGAVPDLGGADEPVPDVPVASPQASGSPDAPVSIPGESCGSLGDAENCGYCGHDCTALPNVVPEAMGCRDGTCVYGEGSCRPGFGHCSADSEAGCRDSLSETAHCGSCDTPCTALAPLCASPPGEPARCVETCDEGSGLTLCGDQCVDTTTDLEHCRFCFTPCSTPFGEGACVASECVVVSCAEGYADCDAASGCETPLGTPDACGGCGDACTAANAIGSCNSGVCAYECATGFGNCDAASPDCETRLDTGSDCGGCGIECSGELGVCDGGVCSAGCTAPREPCGTTCTDLLSNPAHCGACDSACEAYQVCYQGRCAPDYRDTIQTPRDYFLSDVAVLADGSFVVGGSINAPIDLDPGPAIDVRAPPGNRDGLLMMFDADGVLAWSRLFGAADDARPAALAVDADGSVVVPFYYSGSIDFGAASGVPPLPGPISYSLGVVKFDRAGRVLWARTFDTGAGAAAHGVASVATVGPNGTVYLGGSFSGSIDLDPTAGTQLADAERDSPFIVALSAQGEFIWGTALTGCAGHAINALEVDPRGTLWAAGEFSLECDLDPGPAIVPVTQGYGFLLRLEAADGRFISGTGIDAAGGTLAFDDDGSTYFALAAQTVLMKLDASGALEWTRSFEDAHAMSLARSAHGGVVVAASSGIAAGFFLFEVDREGEMRWRIPLENVAGALLSIASNATGFAALGEADRPELDFDPGQPVELPDATPRTFITRYAFDAP